jgi:hypothetical protein
MTEEGTTTGTDGGTETAYSSYPAQECIAALAAPRPIYCRGHRHGARTFKFITTWRQYHQCYRGLPCYGPGGRRQRPGNFKSVSEFIATEFELELGRLSG